MSDRLAVLLERFGASAHTFHAGALCGVTDLSADEGMGQVHLLKRGTAEISHPGQAPLAVDTPSLLLYARPMAHRFVTDPLAGAEFACANLRFEGGAANPLAAALPPFVCIPLAQLDGARSVLALLFDEAFSQRCGRQAMVDRLFEVVLVQVLRHLMDSGQLRAGMLSGMGHPQLRHALVAMHEAPGRDWPLEALAERAGMSRSVFANAFREVVGSTPGAYLQAWRIGLTQQALRRGRPLKMIAAEVGYGSEAALSRAFKAQSGVAPRQWLQSQHA